MNLLKHYKQLIATGLTSEQAEEIAFGTYDTSRESVSKQDLEIAMQRLEAHLKMFMIYINGGTVVIGILLPIFLKLVGVL